MKKIIMIRRFLQKDNYHFIIEWNDGLKQTFRLSEIQMQCPCAGCCEPEVEKAVENSLSVQRNVEATTIQQIGRYGLKIQFTFGCSQGIYSFEHLRQMK